MQSKIKNQPKPKTSATSETTANIETRNAFGLTEKQAAILAAHNAKHDSPPFKFAKRCDKIDLATSKAFKRETAKFTPRLHSAHAGLVAAFQPYSNEPFQARILDNGQAAILINSGFLAAIKTTGQQNDSLLRDAGSELLMLQLTEKALNALQAVKA